MFNKLNIVFVALIFVVFFTNVSFAETVNAVHFDGVSNYLTRATDLTGNTESKLFTASWWSKTNSRGFVYYAKERTNLDANIVKQAQTSLTV